MSTKKESAPSRYDLTVRRATILTQNYRGFTLGDLRKLVAATEGMSDEAIVTVEEPSAHWARREEWDIKRVRVYEEVEPS